MGSSENFPSQRDSSATTTCVAELLAGLALPPIEPLTTDITAMADLPALPLPGTAIISPESESEAPVSQLDVARRLLNDCGESLVLLTKHQNSCAALAAVLIERFESATELEDNILAFDQWQRELALRSIRAEVAGILLIPEGVAARLIEHASSIVRLLPTTLSYISSGELGWEYGVIIVEETKLLRDAGLPAETIDAFELALLGKAEDSSVQSFREKARRLRERKYPETIPARTRKAYADRYLRVSRGYDGMSSLSLYAPAPTLEGMWDQCTATAQAAQGPHEERTLTQLRADVAAAFLVNQSMAENQIFAPAIVVEEPRNLTSVELPEFPELPERLLPVMDDDVIQDAPVSPIGAVGAAGPAEFSTDSGSCGSDEIYPDVAVTEADFSEWVLPHFDDPDYFDPSFKAPDPWGEPGWRPEAVPPVLTPVPLTPAGAGRSGDPRSADSRLGDAGAGSAAESNGSAQVWPPMPRVMPVLLVPALSLLGATNEPAWLESVGPISMEVAQRLTAAASSFYRVLTDPMSNEPLDLTPECYRITSAMRLMLAIRDEYCQFPGCMSRATCSEVDHVQAFTKGGRSVFANLEHLCRRHHQLKHFKDDRTKNGQCRTDQSPEREQVRLRGWTPFMTEAGVAWTSPTGIYFPPEPRDTQPPVYPEWLKDSITEALDDCVDWSHDMTEPAYLAEEDLELMNNKDYLESLDREFEEYCRTHPEE